MLVLMCDSLLCHALFNAPAPPQFCPHTTPLTHAHVHTHTRQLTCVREGGNVVPDEWGGNLTLFLKPSAASAAAKEAAAEAGGAGDGSNAVAAPAAHADADTDAASLQEVTLTLDTTGKRKIAAAFSTFFIDAGLGDGSGQFEWGNTYYNYPKFEGKKLPRTFKP